jgi:hypothetical protein
VACGGVGKGAGFGLLFGGEVGGSHRVARWVGEQFSAREQLAVERAKNPPTFETFTLSHLAGKISVRIPAAESVC